MAYPVRGSMDPTPEQVEARIEAHARGEPYLAIMAEFGISYSACVQFKRRHLPEIEERMALHQLGIHDRASQLWINDQAAQLEALQELADDILQRRNEPDLPARDVSRYNRDTLQSLYRAAELAGLIKQRSQSEVEVKTPFKLGDVMAFGPNGELHEVRSDGLGSDG